MAQWYAIVYKSGPLVGEVRSYGTVITDPLNTTKYEAIKVDHQPDADEMWDKVAKVVIRKPPDLAQIRRGKLKAKDPGTWTEQDKRDAQILL